MLFPLLLLRFRLFLILDRNENRSLFGSRDTDITSVMLISIFVSRMVIALGIISAHILRAASWLPFIVEYIMTRIFILLFLTISMRMGRICGMFSNLKIFAVLACFGMLGAFVLTVVLVRDSFRRAKQYDEKRRNPCPGEAGGIRNPDASGERDKAVKDSV